MCANAGLWSPESDSAARLRRGCRTPLTAVTAEAIHAADPRAASALGERHRLLRPTSDQAVPQARQLQQLSRLTFAASEAAIAASLFTDKNPVGKAYHVLAVQPLSERVFHQVRKTFESCCSPVTFCL